MQKKRDLAPLSGALFVVLRKMILSRSRQVLGAIAVVLTVAAMLASSPAHAITNGQSDGARHPYVGAPLNGDIPWCSGVLVGPREFLTAAHCFGHDLDVRNTWVSFDSVVTSDSRRYHGTTATYGDPHSYVGTAGYSSQYGNSDGYDLAVVHLDEAPPISPARLPTAGLLDRESLRDRTFTVVGYGLIRYGKTGGPNAIEDNYSRNVATSRFRSLQPHFLTLSGNFATGDGGICYGDSGGPSLLGDSDLVVALLSNSDAACRSTFREYRLDTDGARAFLAAQGVPLP